MYKDTSKLRFFLTVFGIIILSNCNTEKNNQRKIFRWNFSAPFSTLDPIHIKSQSDVWINKQIYSMLFNFEDSLKFDVAKSYQLDSLGTTYTIEIERDIKFHPHSQLKNLSLTAFDVEYSLRRLINPQNAARGAWVLNSHIDDTLNIKAIDSHTFTIKLKRPFSTFLNLLSLPQTSIVPAELVRKNNHNLNDGPIGSGPFNLVKYKQGEYVVLERNKNYHHKTKGNIKEIIISFNENKQSELLSFFQHKIDLVMGFDASTKDMILETNGEFIPKIDDEFKANKIEFLNTEYLAFNLNDSLLNSEDGYYFRKAIAFALNKKDIVDFYRNGIGTPAETGFVPNISSSNNQPLYHSFNLDSSKYYLNKISNLQNYVPLKLLITANYVTMANVIQNQLNYAGITCQIEIYSPSALLEMKLKGAAKFFRGSWIADYPDEENYLSLFLCKNKAPEGSNYSHFCNSTFDNLYYASTIETDKQKRSKIYIKMNKILMNSYAILPIYFDETIVLHQRNISNLKLNKLNIPSLEEVIIN